MPLQQERQAEVEILRPKGILFGSEETFELEKALRDLIKQKCPRILVNLSKVSHINSTALGVLMTANSKAVRAGLKLMLCGVDVQIKNVFATTKLNLVFNCAETESEA